MPPLAGNTTPFMNYTLSLTPDQELAHYKKPWTASKSSSLYKIHSWGVPYFTVNAEGNMAVHPFGRDTKPNEEIDIMKAVQKVMESRLLGDLGLSSPLIVRFPDVLKDRLERLQFAFDSGIKAHHYQGQFQGVFPVKCNQDRFVVENIVEFGKPYGFGLEAGSKPELLLAMASLCRGSPNALLVCNGYKDADYVCLALMAKQLRLNCVIVLEQEEELDVVLNMSRKLCIEPFIGLRAKLNTKHAGHFGETSGENGKFGLSCSQIINIVHKLRRLGMLHCLQLLHFHIGSQIPSLAILNDGVSEAAHIYCELNLMGANMQYIDIGGGLGIDYDGSSSAESDMSVGYTMLEYAKEVVLAVKSACLMKGVKQPTLCSESGRALVSHHSVLVFDVLSAQEKGKHATRDKGVPLEVDGTLPEELRSLQHSLTDSVHAGDYKSMLEHAKQMKVDCIDLFKRGELSLMQLASVNSLFEVVSALLEEKRHEMVSGMGSLVSCDPLSYGDGVQVGNESSYNAIYHINLSIFKSMPDTWAIGQLFPIVPLHRLEEEPTVRAILSDLTCDSDGKITTFLGSDGKGKRMNFMKVHPLQDGKPYFMGMFLGGAYQEALGGMHNLFGAPPVVHAVRGNKGGGSVGNVKVIKVSDGQKASDVLRGMQYDPISMMENLSLQVQKCLKERNSGEQEEVAMTVMHTLACSFASSTYLSTNNFASSVVSTMFQPTATGCFALI